MRHVGLNEKLYKRRIELHLGLKEASIMLDISKTRLKLIEAGYIKVWGNELKELFIYKYKLDSNFFEDDKLLYPSIIETKNKTSNSNSPFIRFFTSLGFKLTTLGLALGCLGMFIGGLVLSPTVVNNIQVFFSDNIQNSYQNAVNSGKLYKCDDSLAFAPYVVNEDYYAIEEENEYDSNLIESGIVFYRSINFFKSKSNLPYLFFLGQEVIKGSDIPLCPFPEDKYLITFDTRPNNGKLRTNYIVYEFDGTLDYSNPIIHISADHTTEFGNYDIQTIESRYDGIEPISKETSLTENIICTIMFEHTMGDWETAINKFFETNVDKLSVDFASFVDDENTCIRTYGAQYSMIERLVIWGAILSVVLLAIFGLSLISTKSVENKLKILDESTVSYDISEINDAKPKEPKKLPRNILPAPIIPEFLVRIFAIAVALISSFGLYYIFLAIGGADPVNVIKGIQFKEEIAAFSTLSMLLLLFIKLDMKESQKDTFIADYFLFFFGLIFYILLLIVNASFSSYSSTIAQAGSIFLSILPGNIVWGILAFNLLATFLFSTPKEIKGNKKKTRNFRLLSIIPISYMAASVIIQIGSKAGGWNIPFAISSLFFSKALFLTAFAILYCFGVFIYRKIVNNKYGSENGQIYQHGNSYYYMKNIVICFIVALLGVIDLLIGIYWPTNSIGGGANYVILFAIPFILLYHPHHGKRNHIWDISFIALYGFSMMIGILLIANSVSNYISAL